MPETIKGYQVPYNRNVLVEVLVYHWPTKTSGCHCGWNELGKLFPDHVADVYESSAIETFPPIDRK